MMSAKLRRRVNGYIWNEEMTRIHRALDAIRTTTGAVINALEQHPVSVRLLLTYTAQIALDLNTAFSGLRELELIAREEE